MKTDKEGKWQRDDYDGPGEGGKKQATNSNADVVVVSYEKGGRERKKRVVGFLFVSSSGLFFSLLITTTLALAFVAGFLLHSPGPS